MYKHIGWRPWSAMLLVAIMLSVSSCGRVAPVHEPGQIQVSSTPAGAAIFLDGQDTGQITPATITDLPPGEYIVTVQLANHVTSPPQSEVALSELEVVPAAFTLDATVGQLVVDSNPAGAAIWINGSDTGQMTPATIDGVVAGTAIVSLVHPETHFSPSEFSAAVVAGEQTVVAAETFTPRSRRTVLFEGFSNVSCNGCPEMAISVNALMHEEAFTIDRVVYIKYSMWWPEPQDPHFLNNEDENEAPYFAYVVPVGSYFSIPALMANGVLAGGGGSPPEVPGLRSIVDAGTAAPDPGFLIDVTADFSGFNVPVTVTLAPAAGVDLTGYSLHVALVQSEVHYDIAPGSGNELEFHWVFRDKANTTPALGALTAGSNVDFNLSLSRDDWDLSTLEVIAYVQHDSSFEVPQAGATMITGTTGLAANFYNDETFNLNDALNDSPGGNRP